MWQNLPLTADQHSGKRKPVETGTNEGIQGSLRMQDPGGQWGSTKAYGVNTATTKPLGTDTLKWQSHNMESEWMEIDGFNQPKSQGSILPFSPNESGNANRDWVRGQFTVTSISWVWTSPHCHTREVLQLECCAGLWVHFKTATVYSCTASVFHQWGLATYTYAKILR